MTEYPWLILFLTAFISFGFTCNNPNILFQVTSLFKEIGIGNITVQVEKEAFFQHMSGLGVSMNQVYEMTKNIKALNCDHSTMFIKAI